MVDVNDIFAIKTVDDLWEHIGYTVLSAPDHFPKEDFLSDEDQMTLDRAFALLRDGVEVAYPEVEWAERKKALYTLLDQSYAAYISGDIVKGAHTLQDFQNMIFKSEE